MKATLDDIRKVEDLEDGSSIYEIGAPVQETSRPSSHKPSKFPTKCLGV